MIHLLEQGQEFELLVPDYQKIKKNFDGSFMNLLNLLALLNKNTNSNYLYQLLLRLDYNDYYKE